MHLPCPHCGAALWDDGSLAGQEVACPHCGGRMRLPGVVLDSPGPAWPVAGELVPAPQSALPAVSPTVHAIVIQSPRAERAPRSRVRTRDWTLRAAVVAVLAVAGVIAAVAVIDHLRVERVKRELRQAFGPSPEQQRIAADAIRMAEARLAKHGYHGVSSETAARPAPQDPTLWAIVGHTQQTRRAVPFTVIYRRVAIGGETRWELRLVAVDGASLYEAPD